MVFFFISKCKQKCLNSTSEINETKIGKANFCVFRLSLKYYGGSIYPHYWLNLPSTAGKLSHFAIFFSKSFL